MKSYSLSKEIRKLSLEMVHNSNASHIGSALSMVDILAVLYNDILKFDSNNPNLEIRDKLILSKGHSCVSLYAVLGLKNFFDIELLKTYGKNGSDFMNHISHKVPGVEFSTGSLGHGLPYAVGIALGNKLKKIDSKVYVILGDGEVAEGSNWEAILFASHYKLNNLVIIIDNNNLQSLTTVDETLSLEPYDEKFSSFGCNVVKVDGHDHKKLYKVFSIKKSNLKPTVIIAKTIKGKGVSFMENQVKWHYKSPNSEELSIAIKEINNA
jgi:transketolase